MICSISKLLWKYVGPGDTMVFFQFRFRKLFLVGVNNVG